MSQLAKVFEVNRTALNLRRGFRILVALLVPLVVLYLIHLDQYWLSMAFGALFVGLTDPGGDYGYRVLHVAGVGMLGAAVTFLGFAIGGVGWGWIVLAVFVITLAGGLSMTFGLHRFAARTLLNIWFLIALSAQDQYHLEQVHTIAWAQAVAWLAGTALVIVYTGSVWLVRGRTAQAQPAAGMIPGAISPIPLTRPVIAFAVIRAIAVAGSAAVPFGLQLPNADWMPVATLVAMKRSLRDTTLVAEQRVAGAIIGAAAAALFLLTVDNGHALAVVVVVLVAVAASVVAMNYAWFCAALAGAVLIAMCIPNPSNLTDERRRILFTLAGVGIAVVVMLLASLVQQRAAARQPTPVPGSG